MSNSTNKIKGGNIKIDPNLEKSIFWFRYMKKGDTCLTPGKIDSMCPLTSIFVKIDLRCNIMPFMSSAQLMQNTIDFTFVLYL